jgi:hypothetical protein
MDKRKRSCTIADSLADANPGKTVSLPDTAELFLLLIQSFTRRRNLKPHASTHTGSRTARYLPGNLLPGLVRPPAASDGLVSIAKPSIATPRIAAHCSREFSRMDALIRHESIQEICCVVAYGLGTRDHLFSINTTTYA